MQCDKLMLTGTRKHVIFALQLLDKRQPPLQQAQCCVCSRSCVGQPDADQAWSVHLLQESKRIALPLLALAVTDTAGAYMTAFNTYTKYFMLVCVTAYGLQEPAHISLRVHCCNCTSLTGLPQCVVAALTTVNDGEYYLLQLALPSIAAPSATAAELVAAEVCQIGIAIKGLLPSAKQRLWLEVTGHTH
jgi:hypothetical protein